MEYHAELVRCRLDHKDFEDMQQSLSRKTKVEKLSEDFEIFYTFRAICTQLPEISYVEHMESRVMAKEVASLELLTIDQCNIVENFGKTKYRLYQWRIVEYCWILV